MAIDYPPQRNAARDDAFFAALSPLLEEADRLQERSPHRSANNILPLLEENARLRKLAVKLSNLLGDLPASGAVGVGPERS